MYHFNTSADSSGICQLLIQEESIWVKHDWKSKIMCLATKYNDEASIYKYHLYGKVYLKLPSHIKFTTCL